MKASTVFFLASLIIGAPHMSAGAAIWWQWGALLLMFLAIWRES